MRRLPFTIGALALAIAQAGNAAETPRSIGVDSRVRYVNYDDRQVYKVQGVFRTATQIVFGEGETIASVALGDTVSWEVAPAANMLFVKPKERAGPTNLIVVTRRGSQVRTYQFELSVRAGTIAVGSDAVFQVRFRYPAEEAAASRQAASDAALMRALQVEAGAVKLALDAAVLEGKRNLDYAVAGSGDLQPSEVTDNGQFTVMRFPRNQAIPAIFAVGPDGSETVVAYDVRDDFVVIHQVARQFRLRRGKAVLCIWNNQFDQYGRDLSTGTASPVVERQIESN